MLAVIHVSDVFVFYFDVFKSGKPDSKCCYFVLGGLSVEPLTRLCSSISQKSSSCCFSLVKSEAGGVDS